MRPLPPPSTNPLARVLTLIAAAVAVGISLLFGFIAFLVLAGMALLLVAIVAARLMWLRHRLRRQFRGRPAQPPADSIEGEFHVTGTARREDER
jgi:hypothetical protein